MCCCAPLRQSPIRGWAYLPSTSRHRASPSCLFGSVMRRLPPGRRRGANPAPAASLPGRNGPRLRRGPGESVRRASLRRAARRRYRRPCDLSRGVRPVKARRRSGRAARNASSSHAENCSSTARTSPAACHAASRAVARRPRRTPALLRVSAAAAEVAARRPHQVVFREETLAVQHARRGADDGGLGLAGRVIDDATEGLMKKIGVQLFCAPTNPASTSRSVRTAPNIASTASSGAAGRVVEQPARPLIRRRRQPRHGRQVGGFQWLPRVGQQLQLRQAGDHRRKRRIAGDMHVDERHDFRRLPLQIPRRQARTSSDTAAAVLRPCPSSSSWAICRRSLAAAASSTVGPKTDASIRCFPCPATSRPASVPASGRGPAPARNRGRTGTRRRRSEKVETVKKPAGAAVIGIAIEVERDFAAFDAVDRQAAAAGLGWKSATIGGTAVPGGTCPTRSPARTCCTSRISSWPSTPISPFTKQERMPSSTSSRSGRRWPRRTASSAGRLHGGDGVRRRDDAWQVRACAQPTDLHDHLRGELAAVGVRPGTPNAIIIGGAGHPRGVAGQGVELIEAVVHQPRPGLVLRQRERGWPRRFRGNRSGKTTV